MFFRSLFSSIPWTLITPFWWTSSRLRHLMRVDLPEPDGPQMTIRSPLFTSRLISRSTWK